MTGRRRWVSAVAGLSGLPLVAVSCGGGGGVAWTVIHSSEEVEVRAPGFQTLHYDTGPVQECKIDIYRGDALVMTEYPAADELRGLLGDQSTSYVFRDCVGVWYRTEPGDTIPERP